MLELVENLHVSLTAFDILSQILTGADTLKLASLILTHWRTALSIKDISGMVFDEEDKVLVPVLC